jgi:hypothetical protein
MSKPTPIDRGRKAEAERIISEIVARMKPDLETAVKQAILDDYCEGRITQAEAEQQIKALGLKGA